MRIVISLLAALGAAFSISQAGAAPLGNPAALGRAIDETALTVQVHCRPGWYHHSYRTWDGCYRGYYGGYYYGGGYYPYRRGYYRGVYRRGVYRGAYYRGVYRGGVYRGAYRGGVYRGGARVAYRGGAVRGGAAFRGGGRTAVRAGGGFRGGGGGRGGGRRSDIQLKQDIALLGYLENGIAFYRFAYTGSETAYVGVMAQDVQHVRPDAVARGRDGYLRVFYDRLGLQFQTYDQWIAAGAQVPSGRTATGH